MVDGTPDLGTIGPRTTNDPRKKAPARNKINLDFPSFQS
jgi:hypothetical protein